MSSYGVLVASDQTQEWLLPHWWTYFMRYAAEIPVAFGDLGMSELAREWCRERGSLLQIPKINLQAPRHQLFQHWERQTRARGNAQELAPKREIWFRKPLALSLSPFERTVWLDLDCEVRRDLTPCFALPLPESKMALCQEETILHTDQTLLYPHYNTGIVIFESTSCILKIWAQSAQLGSSCFRDEEELLSYLIAHAKIPILPLPAIYNWKSLKYGENRDAIIYHWMGETGKKFMARAHTDQSKWASPLAPSAPLPTDTSQECVSPLRQESHSERNGE